MHMRLECIDSCVLCYPVITVGTDNGIGWDFEFIVRNVANRNRADSILRNDALWVELESDRRSIVLFIAGSEIMHIEPEAGAFLQQPSCVLGKNVSVLSNSIFVEHHTGLRRSRRRIRFDHIYDAMMDDLRI